MSSLKNLAVAGVVGLLGVFAGSAAAEMRMGYLSLSGGVDTASGDAKASSVTDSRTGAAIPDYDMSLDTGWDGSVAGGLYIDQFRVEVQYTVQYNEISKIKYSDGFEADASGAIHSNLFMLNGYYDIPVADRLSVYVGAGVGALYVTRSGEAQATSHHITDQHGTSFAYQVMAGVEYQVDPIVSVFAGYRGWSALDVGTQTDTLAIPWYNMAEIGLRVSF